ncbi:UDP-N-acetylmuramate dehydrogenase [Paraglaciecola chathamensis]|uniref:UDP-N-acetylmuramate dehydrogenase n=1 Tax=Paraglaciecola chathamensis TaxID=368405 RepID=UPI00270C5AF6|nr:UDP-N-acetylmuramate dehydrogenase [Paraglaciecola chathamensis]MDO6838784.1 UDP-N-acetylmuramate dehydrogenase [Paraglaciecola chathamensis]
MDNSLILKLLSNFECEVAENVALRDLTRWKIGGNARLLIQPLSIKGLSDVLNCFHHNKIPKLVVGSTSNLLFSDEGLNIPLIQIGSNLSRVEINGNLVTCESGIWVPGLARLLATEGLSGLEHICGIPGTLGGLIYMNGGSQRKGIGLHIISVTTIDDSGELNRYSNSDCEFAYRSSIFQKKNETIVSCELELVEKSPKEIKHEVLSILRSRRLKFPNKLPNCGSVFVSDPAMYADYGPPGKVIEDANLKGVRRGGAAISELHANFIVNEGTATAKDVLALIHLARETVKANTGYSLKAEAIFIEPDGKQKSAHVKAAEIARSN